MPTRLKVLRPQSAFSPVIRRLSVGATVTVNDDDAVALVNDGVCVRYVEGLDDNVVNWVDVVGGDAAVAAAILVLYNARTGASETLNLADTNGVSMNNAGASVLTIPLNSTVAFPVGQMIPVLQLGAGQVTVSPASSVTLQSRGAAYKLAGQYAQAVLVQVSTNVWNLSGDITT